MDFSDILIIGAGHGGVSVASELRRAGFIGSVTLINGEAAQPYHRPPLSKAWLKGCADEESGWLQHPSFFELQNIDLRSGTRVEELDANRRVAHLDDGGTIRFTHAVLATGALARPLPSSHGDTASFLQLRDAADAAALKDLITSRGRFAIIGGGFIGLEVAATARLLGADVCVIERESRLLARLASAPLSQHLAALHLTHGVDLQLGTDVADISPGENGGADITLGENAARAFDHVLVAIGAIPDDALARSAGLECANGIVVDEGGHTSQRHIFAIGDVARRPLGPYAESMRLESVHNANEQARIVAAEITGTQRPTLATPWFWSDQYDCKLQIAGLLPADGDTEVRGDPTFGSFALLHRVEGRLRCVEAVNSSREFALGKRQIAADTALPTMPR
ncbi:NAD(P)/FAD-dependent oxidoreductase [Nocardia asteroides]|uniref:NAD(P)/FAD-dependent oxidoreductase n=1 Tax=Nocardia asteroides TaxID=1824 RepID=UPI0034059527